MDSLEILPIQISVNKLRRKTLKDTLEWDSFLKSEWKQLDRYEIAGVFGEPVQMEQWMILLPWVWTYLYKEDPITVIDEARARKTCNGGPRYGEVHQLTWTISTALNLYCKGYHIENSSAEAPAPVNPFFMYLDDQ